MDMEKQIRINVGGTQFITTDTTLKNIPGSKLSLLLENSKKNLDDRSHEFFFDRDPVVFNSVLNLYRNGSLHLPKDQCGVHTSEELKFWGIPESKISPCCLKSFYQSFDQIEIHTFLSKEMVSSCSYKYSNEHDNAPSNGKYVCQTMSRLSRMKESLWLFLMNPNSSRPSKVWHMIYMAIVLLSIFLYCIDKLDPVTEEVVPPIGNSSNCSIWLVNSKNDFHDLQTTLSTNETSQNKTRDEMANMTSEILSSDELRVGSAIQTLIASNRTRLKRIVGVQPVLPVLILDTFCNSFFTVEFILRLFSCPDKKAFITFLNFVDLISIVGFGTSFILEQRMHNLLHECGAGCDFFKLVTLHWNLVSALFIAQLLLAFRTFRFFILGRIHKGFNLLILAIKRSRREMFIFVLVILTNAVVFSGLIFYAEDDTKFPNFYVAFYWAVITMTTVGYGDTYPVNDIGKAVAICCSISGLFLLTMPVTVISANFSGLYFRNKDMERQRKRNNKRNKDDLPKHCGLGRCNLTFVPSENSMPNA